MKTPIVIDMNGPFEPGSVLEEAQQIITQLAANAGVDLNEVGKGIVLWQEDYKEVIMAEFVRRFRSGELDQSRGTVLDADVHDGEINVKGVKHHNIGEVRDSLKRMLN